MEEVVALQKQLIGWNAKTVWNRFDGTFPHVIPADPARRTGQGRHALRERDGDSGTTAAQQNAAKLAFLQVPDMIQLGVDVEVRGAAARG